MAFLYVLVKLFNKVPTVIPLPHLLIVLDRLVVAALAKPGRVVEVAGGDALPDGGRVQRVGRELYLHPLQQRLQLVPDVPGPLHAAVLDIVLVAPLATVVRLRPLVVHVEQGDVVAARGKEVISGRVRVDDLVLGPVEDGRVVGEHGADGEDFSRAFVLFTRQQHLDTHA